MSEIREKGIGKIRGKIVAAGLALALVIGLPPAAALAADNQTLDNAVNSAASYMLRTVKAPEVGSVGGEWAVIGLARAGGGAPPASYYANYYKTVEQYVKDCEGQLHDKKYTEYSRVILGLTAAGYDPRDVAGYDLTAALGDFERVIWQGVNGPIFALIALDSLDYPIPLNPQAKTQATRDLYLREILRRQTADGGWNLTAGSSGPVGPNDRGDPDITGMALQALARYQARKDVKTAVDKALAFLSGRQDGDGGYSSWGNANSESVVQVLVALCELGISDGDSRFVKNGHTLVDNILSYQNADGSFNHTAAGGGNSQMSTEQAFYGLVAARRARAGQNSLYRMADAIQRGDAPRPTQTAGAGLPDKHGDVRSAPVTSPGKTFPDVASHGSRAAIEALAARGVIGGGGNDLFEPDKAVTRAEFASIVVRGLGLPAKTTDQFTDVPAGAWFYKAVGTADAYGVVAGVGPGVFNPNGAITRQEAAVMVARAARLAGLDTAMNDTAIRDRLAQFGDYRSAAEWTRGALAFCYGAGLLDEAELDIRPRQPIKKCETAEMLYRLLLKADLLQ
ncbi:MAG: S-layer homology domain-containing protein [Peptococcaceae bacterium]|jgi:hypothetical protein|nr:S-layer homology domain-containing protein [Peptococcaceae bacterium]